MSTKRNEALKGGVAALFGDSPIQEPAEAKEPAEQSETQEPAEADLISTVQDEELRRALRKRQQEGRGRTKKGRPKDKRTEGYGTICVKANLEKWAKVEYISLQETLQKKEVLEMALDMLIEKYESEKGKIVLKAKDKTGNVFNK